MNSKLNILLPLLERAVDKLADVLRQERNEYVRDSAIQRFEFTFELMWKTLKAHLEGQGVIVYSPRESIKGAYQIGLIEEDATWLQMIELRNLTTHTYNEEIADRIYEALPGILASYRSLLIKLQTACP